MDWPPFAGTAPATRPIPIMVKARQLGVDQIVSNERRCRFFFGEPGGQASYLWRNSGEQASYLWAK
jgi:hypothetical protein